MVIMQGVIRKIFEITNKMPIKKFNVLEIFMCHVHIHSKITQKRLRTTDLYLRGKKNPLSAAAEQRFAHV